MESIRDTEAFKEVMSDLSMIQKGEIVLEHLPDNKLSAYFEYRAQLRQLKEERERVHNAMFEMLEDGVAGKDDFTGIRSNGETVVLVKIPKPDNIGDAIKGFGISIGGCKLN